MYHTFLVLSGGELLIVFLVFLLLFGSSKIPELAKGLGKGLREFKKATDDIKREINDSTGEITRDISESAREIRKNINDVTEGIARDLDKSAGEINKNLNDMTKDINT
jgi:sec-independent protein translocase protein TatA